MIVLWVILWVLAGILGLALLFLLVPLHASAQGTAEDFDVFGAVQISWGFGLVRIRVPGRDTPKKNKKTKKKEKGRWSRRPGLSWVLRHRSTILRILGRLLGSFRFEGRVSGTIGTGDPADTAMVFQVLRTLDARTDLLTLDIAPRWTDEGWDLEGRVRLSVWPIRTAVTALGLLLRRDVRETLKTARV